MYMRGAKKDMSYRERRTCRGTYCCPVLQSIAGVVHDLIP